VIHPKHSSFQQAMSNKSCYDPSFGKIASTMLQDNAIR